MKCEEKKRFETEMEAIRFYQWYRNKYYDGSNQHVYKCSICEFYHLTTNRVNPSHKLINDIWRYFKMKNK